MDAYIAALETLLGPKRTSELEAVCRAHDLDALSAYTEAQRGVSSEDVLPGVRVPCLLFVGEADDEYVRVKRAGEIMPNATFVSFPGLDHIDPAVLVLALPHITTFLEEVGQS